MKRLTPAKVTMLMFVVVGGLIVAYIAKGLLGGAKPPEAKTRNVPMALADLAPGTLVTEDHLGTGPVLESELSRDVMLQSRVIVGRIVKEKLTAAAPIRSGQLYEVGTRPELKLEKGMRAVTIDARAATAIVDGLIKPGTYVDTHFMPNGFEGDPRAGRGLTMTLLKGVKIIAINRQMLQGRVGDSTNTVTLELTPEEANVVLLAHAHGVITFSYNPQGKGDGLNAALKGKDRATLEEILGLEPVKPPELPFVSQVYRKADRQEIQFPGNNRVIEQNGGAPQSTVTPPPPTAPNGSPPGTPSNNGSTPGNSPSPAPGASPNAPTNPPADPSRSGNPAPNAQRAPTA